MINDDCQTPLEIARGKGYSNVVRTIEGHVCLFSGWLRELYGPGFLELLAPQLLSRKVWVVVLPCGSRNLKKPFKLELAIYASAQDAQPRLIIPLWKANLEEPNFNLTDPAAIVSDIASKTRVKLAHANESDKQQLQRFCNACKGIPQVTHSTFPVNTQVPAVQATAPPASEDEEVAMAINASLQAAAHEGPPVIDSHPVASTSLANTIDSSNPGNSDIWGASITHKGSDETLQKEGPSGCEAQHIPTQNIIPSVVQSTLKNPSTVSVPSAPPVADAVPDDGPIHYPSIDSSPVDLSSDAVDALLASLDGKIEDNAASSCTICLDAPVEGACVPCGHMAGCMSCLNEIKAKKWGCPVCRANIDQVIRIYAV
ncbi:E3 ubiquitin- ligase XBAT34 isoform X2 [Olea europaea subsp. europaea]|uniref:E3 ubiquitin- ligase XBAT34 isoform X2 n=1 Tax=Olea europaea subsp. europaea TaxID=158383 RepID=A0A8S0RNG9_OLEEU|nr:E3 ubiquitin- ligase XBAT34 isoform X2 [Olea europaea subsp. europaea]